MNDFDEELAASVAATASFGAAAVAERVARRRRARRGFGVAVAGLTLTAGIGLAIVLQGGGDEPDVEAVDDPPSSVPVEPDVTPELTPLAEGPIGDDGVSGAMSDFHVETSDTFGFTACGADGEPGPPEGPRAAELEAVVEALRDGGLHDQPFVVSSGGPQSIWGVPSIGLSAWYEPTLAWLAERVDPADVCVEFPEFGVRNLPPELAPIAIEFDAAAGEVVVTADGCAPKGEWVQPFIRNRSGAAEVGIAVGRGGLVFTDDCPLPTPHVFELLDKAEVRIADVPGTLVFEGAVAAGESIDFSFDAVNAASTTTGDDLIAQHADDPTVQFQMSDVFGGSPVAGAVGEVVTDQWPVTGAGTIVVPEGVPAGTYFVHVIDAPELNGTLEVAGGGPPATDPAPDGAVAPTGGPDAGWILPDRNADGVVEVAALDGALYVSEGDSYRPLLDADGRHLGAPVEGDASFACFPEWGLVVQYIDDDGDGDAAPGTFLELTVVDGVGAWVMSVGDVIGDTPLPEPGEGCVAFAKG